MFLTIISPTDVSVSLCRTVDALRKNVSLVTVCVCDKTSFASTVDVDVPPCVPLLVAAVLFFFLRL